MSQINIIEWISALMELKQDKLEDTITLKFTLENGEVIEHTFYEELQ